jgi:hypothetical protein
MGELLWSNEINQLVEWGYLNTLTPPKSHSVGPIKRVKPQVSNCVTGCNRGHQKVVAAAIAATGGSDTRNFFDFV